MGAGRNIKGITVEIGGDTTGLQKALQNVNNSIKSTESQLRDVNNLLKLDPSNTVLVAQKQELLTQAISESAEKLKTLEAAQKDVTASFESGKIGQEQYMAFQREVEATRATVNRYESELSGLSTEQDRLSTNTERLNKLFSATGTSVDDYADVLGSKLVSAIKNGSASSDQLKLAIEKIGKSAAGGKADIKQLTDALDTVDDGQAIQNLIQDLKDAGDQADDTSDQLEEMGSILQAGVIMEAADQISGLGDKITELGSKATDAFAETENATVKASSYFGETGEAAEQTADIIKNVYTEGVGESMDSVSEAVIAVKKNLKNLDETELTNLTEQAITLDELYGIDMNETLRGVNSLMEQFGMSGQEAMDYIVKGTQNGLDKTDELGDNLSEYSGKFAQAGYSAQEYFQLLQNGLEGGAYNLDKVNDAINEVTTRLADGTIGESIEMYSGKTQELFKKWQEGGATQKEVIDSIVQDIAGTKNQQEALNKAAQAFGTMAEDGNLKFISSLTSVGDTYDDVSGAAQGMFDATTTPMQTMEANTRKLEQALVPLGEILLNLANQIIPPLVSAVTQVSDFFTSLPGPVQNFIVILTGLIAAFTALAPVIAAVVTIFTTLGTATLGPVVAGIAAVVAIISVVITAITNWGEVSEWLKNLWEEVCSFLTRAGKEAVDAISAKFNEFASWWSGIWQQVKDLFSEVWNKILSFFTDTIPSAWESVVSFFEQIPGWWNSLWQQVGDFFSGIWNGIIGFFTDKITGAWNTTVSFFEQIPGWWNSLWQQVGDFFSSVWNRIIGFFTETIPAAWESVVSFFTGIPEWWSGIWQNVSEIFSSVWDQMMQNPLLSDIISTIVSLWENGVTTIQGIWNGLKDIAANIWELIKNVVLAPVLLLIDLVTGDFDALSSDTQNIWNNIKTAASNIWNGIKEVISTLVQGLITGVTTLIDGLKTFLEDAWEVLKTTAVNSWETAKNTVIQIVTTLKETVIQLIEDFKNLLSQTWTNIQTFAVDTWNNLKTSIVNTAVDLKNAALKAIEDLKTFLSQTWTNIKTGAVNTWNNLKSSVITAAQNLKTSVQQTITNLKNALPQIWASLKTTAVNTWNNLKTSVINTANNLKNSAVTAFKNLVSGIRSALSSLGSVVKNGFQSAINFITSLPEKAIQWGKDFINGLVKGIKSAVGAVKDAVCDVADTIRSYLHFSVPDIGPLTEYESWMPDFMEGLARGIERSKGMVLDAINNLVNGMNLSGLLDGNLSISGSGAGTVTGGNGSRGLDDLLAMLQQYLPYLAQGHALYWDTGEVAGQLAPDMNTELNHIRIREEGR